MRESERDWGGKNRLRLELGGSPGSLSDGNVSVSSSSSSSSSRPGYAAQQADVSTLFILESKPALSTRIHNAANHQMAWMVFPSSKMSHFRRISFPSSGRSLRWAVEAVLGFCVFDGLTLNCARFGPSLP